MKLLAPALWALAMALGLALIARIPFSADLSAFLPAHPQASQRLLVEQLRSGVAARTVMAAISGGDPAGRAAASRELAAALRAGGQFEQVQNGDRDGWQAAGALLVAHRYRLSPAIDEARFTVEGLRDAVGETLSLLGTPADSVVGPLLERDPTGETQRVAEMLVPANAPRLEEGVWVSRSAPRALLLLTTRADGSDVAVQQALLDDIRRAFQPQAARGFTLALSGTPVFAVQSRDRIEHEAALLGGTGLAAVGALLLAAFASLPALAVALVPVATGVVAGIAVTGLLFASVHGLTLAFGSTLIGEAVDYAIYFLIQAREQGAPAWCRRSWPTVRLGLFTSVCGFAVLAGSGFPGLSQLGVFSVAGLLAAALATRFVLPALMPGGAPGRPRGRRLASVAGRALGRLPRARWLLVIGGMAAALGVAGRGDGLWHGDLASLSPVPVAAQRLDAALRADLGASDARLIVVAGGPDRESALQAAERAGRALDSLVDDGALVGYDSPARLLPSLSLQRARRAALPDDAALRRRLVDATRDGPLAAHRLQPFLDDVDAARRAPPLDLADLAGTPLRPIVDALLFERPGGGWAALMPLQAGPQGIDDARVREALGPPGSADPAGGGRAELLDIKASLDDLYARYLHEALLESLAGVAAVIAIVALHLRSARRVAAALAPLALAVVLTLGALAACGAVLGILHVVGLLLVVAVGSNYALFFEQWRASGGVTDDTVASLLLASTTAVIAFGLIALSDIPALSAIGRVVAPGALFALLCCAAFARLPARAAA